MDIISSLLLIFLVCPVLTILIAEKRGRGRLNWFFLTFFYGFFTILFLLLSKPINQGELKESDTLAKTLWALVVAPIIIVSVIICIANAENKADKELEEKVMQNKIEQII